MIESATPTTTLTTHRLEVPGAELAYDVRRGQRSDAPTLLMIGSPMGAAGFASLAGYFSDRTVVTYDPRAVERSRRTDGGTRNTVEEQADDLHRLIAAVSGRPVDIFASSGGAVNGLALVERHPEQVRTLVAHEPPLAAMVPDRAEAMAASRSVHETYLRSGFGAGMAAFMALVSHEGPFPADYPERPAPDPSMFGLPTEDDGSRDDVLLAQNMIATTHYEVDVEALKAASTRIVLAVGEVSGPQLPSRATGALAARLGTTVVPFPGDHGGFMGGEYGQQGEPEAFAARLREVLAG